MVEASTSPPERNRSAFYTGIGATVLMLVSIVGVWAVVGFSISDGHYDSGSLSLGTTDGVQTNFTGKVLGGLSGNYCEVDVNLKNGSDYTMVSFFGCGEDRPEVAEGVNGTWDEESGDLEIVFDTPPESGSEVWVYYMTEPETQEDMPTAVLAGFILTALVLLFWLASVVFTLVQGPREYALGVGTAVGVGMGLYFILMMYLIGTGCGLMC